MAQFLSQLWYFNRQKWRVMLPTTSSAGIIVHSMPLTKIADRECYQLPPSIFKKNITTLQSTTWQEMMDSWSTMASTRESINMESFCWGDGHVMVVTALP
jgi:hypothetical protein